jgi:hypothetical protein
VGRYDDAHMLDKSVLADESTDEPSTSFPPPQPKPETKGFEPGMSASVATVLTL